MRIGKCKAKFQFVRVYHNLYGRVMSAYDEETILTLLSSFHFDTDIAKIIRFTIETTLLKSVVWNFTIYHADEISLYLPHHISGNWLRVLGNQQHCVPRQ